MVSLWLHLLGVALWIGSQVTLILVVLPALRLVSDPATRRAAITALTARYNRFGWSALALLVVTGLGNLGGLLRDPVALFASPYGQTLALKLGLVTAIVALTLLHSRVIGPRLLALPQDAPAPAAAALRRVSILVSAGNLLLSLAVAWLGLRLRFGG